MKVEQPNQQTHARIVPVPTTTSSSPARPRAPASLMSLPEDILQKEIIPQLQAHRGRSLRSFARTSSAGQTQTTLTVSRQLIGQVRSAVNINAFAYDPVASGRGKDPTFKLGEAHPAAAAYKALLRLEKFFSARGIKAAAGDAYAQRSSGSIGEALAIIETAVSACLRPHQALQRPVPHNTVAALQDIRAYMLQPIDAWIKEATAKAVAESTYTLADVRTTLSLIAETALHVKNLTSNDIDFDDRAFSAGILTIPPMWLYDAGLDHLQLKLAPGSTVSAVLSHLPAVRTVKVTGYIDAGQLQDVVTYCSNVENLMLGGLDMQMLPASLTALKQLKRLTLHSDILSNIDCLSSMTRLECLVADNCRNLDFPGWICTFENLELLGFYRCGITAIPDDIVRLQKLRILEIYSENQVDLPRCIRHLNKLEVLELNSATTTLPTFVSEMKSLKILMWGQDSDDLTWAPDTLGHLIKGEDCYRLPELTQDDVDGALSDLLEWYVTL